MVADLRVQAPDLVCHGGDLAVMGGEPAAVVDRIRELGWPGVAGNTDEALWDPAPGERVMAAAPALRGWLEVLLGRLVPWAREALGEERVSWLRAQPLTRTEAGLTLVHATPADLWRAPLPGVPDDQLAAPYAAIAGPVVYGHIHRAFARTVAGRLLANAGSAGLPWDGDPRPGYLLFDGDSVTVRRVAHDPGADDSLLRRAGFPLPEWLATIRARAVFEHP